MRRPIALALLALPLLLSAFAPAAGPPPAAEARTFRQILTTRPAPRLDDLAERCAPDRQGEVASESFWDLLKLRDKPDPAAVPALAKILESHAGSNRIHRFAAAQALLSIGTDEALKAMERDVLRPDYPVDLAVMYTGGWEMAEPGRSRLFERYLLRSVGDKALGVRAVPLWQEREARRVLAVTVTLTNRSEKPLALLLDPHAVGRRLFLRSPDGTVATAGLAPPSVPLPPRWVRLAPGASERFDVALELTQDPEKLRRFAPNQPAAVLSEGGAGAEFGLSGFGRYRVYAMVAQPPVTDELLKTLRAWAKDVGDPKELWTGRAVSEPAQVEIREADPGAGR
jgi:hypothetical protein